jgi:capsular exopolysaccharide synthesis family protein
LGLRKWNKKDIIFAQPNSNTAEEFRAIRTNLQFITNKRKYRTLLITSPLKEEGKTFTTVNLAIAYAEQGKKVIVIDANLRTSNLHTVFDLNNNAGLSNVLSGEKNIQECIVSTNLDRLDVLTSGPTPPNPAKLLISKELGEVMDYVVDQYDLVLVDSSSVLHVSDTKIISHLFEGVILVVSQHKTKTNDAIRAKRVLELADANIVGITMNKANK